MDTPKTFLRGVLLPSRMVFVVNGDCRDELPKMGANTYDLTVTSPPYDNARRGAYDSLSLSSLVKIYKELLRVTKKGGVFCLNIRDSWENGAYSGTTFHLVSELLKVGWRLHSDIIVAKWGRPGGWFNQRFRIDHEYCFNFVKGETPNYFNKQHLKIAANHPGTRYHGTERKSDGTIKPIKSGYKMGATKGRGTVWWYDVGGGKDESAAYKHPAIMPWKLARDLIVCFSEPGMAVFDPMAGSGTTLIQADELGREAYGVEIDEDYYNLIQERIARPKSVDLRKQHRW